MNLGFDFDKIFIDYPPFVPDALINSLYKKKTNDILSYRIPSKPEQLFRLLTHHSFFRPAISENIKFIKKLTADKKHKHYLISSRFGFLKKRTEQLVKKYQFNEIFDGLFFNFEDEQPHVFKNRIIKKLNIHHYVDDDLPLLEFIISKNSKVLCYWLNKKRNGMLKKNLFAITKLSSLFKNL